MNPTPHTIPNNLYFAKDALKKAEGPPDLIWQHLFEPGAGCGGGIKRSFLVVHPHTIAELCCEFHVPRPKTVGGDALQRPKSASKIVRV